MTMLLLCNVVTGQNHMTNKGNKPDTITYFGKLGEVVVAGWDAIFEKDRPKVVQNAFNIGVDTVYETRKQHRENLQLSMANRNIPK